MKQMCKMMVVVLMFVHCCAASAAPLKTRKLNVGDTCKFGSYVQKTGGAPTPIEWIVLDKQGSDKYLMISKYALAARPYNEERADVSWETSSVRAWLNEDFFKDAFNSSQRAKIVPNSLQDKVSLLTHEEARRYFKGNEARICEPTDLAVGQGALDINYRPDVDISSSNKRCWWWLRTKGTHTDKVRAMIILVDGHPWRLGEFVDYDAPCVRPVIWVTNP